ncbi:OmpL47-type beta-barrel domain-containing protein [Elusimicrobiota bacterium]
MTAFAADPPIPVKPGDTGTIRYKIENDAGSIGPFDGVQVTPSAPAEIEITSTLNCGPLSVPKGGSETCEVNYEVASTAQETGEPVKIQLNVSMANDDVVPDPSLMTTSVDFVVQRHPLVTLEHGSVSDGVFSGPSTGTFQGDQTSEPGPWASGSAVRLTMSDPAGVKHLRILKGPADDTEIYAEDFASNIVVNHVVQGYLNPGHEGYRTVVTNSLGEATTFFFHVDRVPPRVDLTEIIVDPVALTYAISGEVQDSTSGVRDVRLNIGGDTPFDETQPFPKIETPGEPTRGPRDSQSFEFSPAPIFRGKQDIALFDHAGTLGLADVYAQQVGGDNITVSIGQVENPASALTDTGDKSYSGGAIAHEARLYITGFQKVPSDSPCDPTDPDGKTRVGTVRVAMASSSSPEFEALEAQVKPHPNQSTPESQIFEEQALGEYYVELNNQLGQKITVTGTRTPRSIGCTDAQGQPATATIYPQFSGQVTVDAVTVIPKDTGEWVYLPPGQNVQTEFPGLGLILTVQNVLGDVNLFATRAPVDCSSYPGDFCLPDSSWDVTAVGDYSGPVTIVVSYDESLFSDDPAAAENIRLLHYENGQYVEVPITFDLVNNKLVGVLPHLSHFFLIAAEQYISMPDQTPPVTTIAFADPKFSDAEGVVHIPLSTASLPVIDPVIPLYETSQVAATYLLVDQTPEDCGYSLSDVPSIDPGQPFGSCENPLYTGDFTVDPGTHTLYYASKDIRGNMEVLRSASVWVDAIGPEVTPTVFGGSATVSGTLYTAQTASITLVATDGGSGVALLEYRIDGGIVQTGPVEIPFLLAEGPHTLSFHAIDGFGNETTWTDVEVRVDGTPPSSDIQPQGPNAPYPGGLIVSPATPLILLGNDPESNGVASGWWNSFYLIDLHPMNDCGFQPGEPAPPNDPEEPPGTCENRLYSGPFILEPGNHIIRFFSMDRAQNKGSWEMKPINVDVSPPETTIEVLGSSETVEGILYVTEGTSVALNAVDLGDPAAGIYTTFFIIDGTPEDCAWGPDPVFYSTMPAGTCLNPLYAEPFALPVGAHGIGFFSVDNVRNIESLHISSITVNRSGPPAVGRFVWVPDYTNQRLLKVDRILNRMVDVIPLPSRPWNIAVGPQYVWVAGDTLSRVNRLTGEVTPVATGVSGPRALAVDKDFVWVAHSYYSLAKLDRETGALITVIPTPAYLYYGGSVAVDDDFVWIVGWKKAFRMDKNTLQVTQLSLPTDVRHMVIDQQYAWILQHRFSRTVLRVDRLSGTVIEPLSVGLLGAAEDLTQDDDHIWTVLSDSGQSWISKLDKVSGQIVALISIPFPRAQVTTAGPDNVWAIGSGNTAVIQVDRETNATDFLPLGSFNPGPPGSMS